MPILAHAIWQAHLSTSRAQAYRLLLEGLISCWLLLCIASTGWRCTWWFPVGCLWWWRIAVARPWWPWWPCRIGIAWGRRIGRRPVGRPRGVGRRRQVRGWWTPSMVSRRRGHLKSRAAWRSGGIVWWISVLSMLFLDSWRFCPTLSLYLCALTS